MYLLTTQCTRKNPKMTAPDVSDARIAPVRQNESAAKAPVVRNTNLPIAALATKGNRWADEKEDDDFLPVQKPLDAVNRNVSDKEGKWKPKRSEDVRETTNHRDAHPSRSTANQPQPRRSDSLPRRQDKQPLETRQDSPKHQPKPPVGKDVIKHVTEMKQVMTGLAEERKKQKQDEEARLEAERRQRCEERLKQLELKKLGKPSTPVISSPSTAAAQSNWKSVHAPQPEREEKRSAFNDARTKPGISKLSAEAPEFVPTPPLPGFYFPPPA